MNFDQNDDETCWICMEGGGDLAKPCACPRMVHKSCMAKWQLHKAGTSEETHCRFCNTTLNNWKTELFPKKNPDSNARPVMRFCLNGKVYYIVPKPGGDGLSDFKDTVRKLCNLSDDTQLDLSFQCSDPVGGSQLNLEGDGAYDAAVHCATVWAESRGADDIPANVIDTNDPASLERHRSESNIRLDNRSRPSNVRPGSRLRRSLSSHNLGGSQGDGSFSGFGVRIPNVLRHFSKKVAVLTQRPLEWIRG